MTPPQRYGVFIFQKIIEAYAFLISPLLGQNCRFHPNCSSYAHHALEKHGVFKGFLLITARLLRCHPWSKQDIMDPVPDVFAWNTLLRYKRSKLQNENKKATDDE